MTEDIKDIIKQKAGKIRSNLISFFKWLAVSGLIGVGVGLVGTAFYYGMKYATWFRQENTWIILGLPAAGIVIVWMYHMADRDNDKGTNMVLAAIRSEDELPVLVAPLIFISTILTHLFGGSVGREGAALQLGGSIGSWLGKAFHMKEKEVNVVIMCGMSAAFSALFGTPMAAAFFSMEVVSVGIMYYAALVPCVFASLIAFEVAKSLGVHGEAFTILDMPELSVIPAVKILGLAVLCAGISVLFCIMLHMVSSQGRKLLPNPFVRAAAAGGVIILMTAVLHSTEYLGTGMEIIERSMAGEVRPEAFLMKMIFTAITLGAGFKGGEIVPSFCVGAAFGCLFGQLFGISPSLCAAAGLVALFCGVTNCPVTSLLIALELFGMEALPYFLISVAVSYMLSGYYGLYHSQRIVYSKYKTEYLNRICH